ncbi:MAG: hypothetical protein HYZ54_03275 [Ignavibacteriae bacterium]|nr:hypothetical protein [Ignavibacteriota bacterium]
MKNRLFFCIMLSICTIAFLKITADECNEYYDALVEKIVATDPSCIQESIDDKIYLNPEKIIPTQQGLFLNLEGENYVTLPMIYSDEYGCYITPVVKVFNNCRHCGREYFVTCDNPDCAGKKIKQQYEDDKRRKKEEAKRQRKEDQNKKK